MKLVRFTRDMAPHKEGETRVVPPALAAELIEKGDAVAEPSVFDPIGEGRAKPYRTRKLSDSN